jgi:hypothetical protein
MRRLLAAGLKRLCRGALSRCGCAVPALLPPWCSWPFLDFNQRKLQEQAVARGEWTSDFHRFAFLSVDLGSPCEVYNLDASLEGT